VVVSFENVELFWGVRQEVLKCGVDSPTQESHGQQKQSTYNTHHDFGGVNILAYLI